MKHYYKAQYRNYNEKRWHTSSKKFDSYEDAERFIDSKKADESKIKLKLVRN